MFFFVIRKVIIKASEHSIAYDSLTNAKNIIVVADFYSGFFARCKAGKIICFFDKTSFGIF